MESSVEYDTIEIDKWFIEHYLDKEQLAKLIADKMERAENYLLAHRQVVRHFD